MNGPFALSSAAVLGTLLLAASAAAQSTTPALLRVGQHVNGSLGTVDPTANGHGRFHAYRMEGHKGERVMVTLRSSAFDSYLTLARMVNGIMDVLKTDDDGGGGTDARLRLTLPANGSYLIIAQAFDEVGRGAYTLTLDTLPTPIAVAPQPIRLGQTLTGRLTESSPFLDEDDSHYALYTYAGRAGERINVTLRSNDFDSYLSIGRMENGSFDELRSADDGAGGNDARIRLTLAANGEYVIRVNTMSAGETGTYTLLVEPMAPVVEATPRPIRAGQTLTGALETSDPEMDDGSYFDTYVYSGRAGEKLVISLDSEAFDSYLIFGRMQNGEFEAIATDDDGGDGTNARLEVTLPAAGDYLIRANSIASGSTGAYRLRVESQR